MSSHPHPSYAERRPWRTALLVAAIMVILALIGVGLSTTNQGVSPTYWICLVPIYGLLCIGTAWKRPGGHVLVLRQVCHWLAIAAAIGLDFYIRRSGEVTGEAAGLTALLLLALGCFLAGVHLEWLFAVVGLVLTATLMLVVKADQYLWLIVAVGIVAFAALLGLMRLVERGRGKPNPTSVGS